MYQLCEIILGATERTTSLVHVRPVLGLTCLTSYQLYSSTSNYQLHPKGLAVGLCGTGRSIRRIRSVFAPLLSLSMILVMLHALYNLESYSLHSRVRLRSIISPPNIQGDHFVFVPDI